MFLHSIQTMDLLMDASDEESTIKDLHNDSSTMTVETKSYHACDQDHDEDQNRGSAIVFDIDAADNNSKQRFHSFEQQKVSKEYDQNSNNSKDDLISDAFHHDQITEKNKAHFMVCFLIG